MSKSRPKPQEIRQGLLAGDPVVLRNVYRDHFGSVATYVKRNNGTEMDAEDVFQETLIVLYRKAKDAQWQVPTSFGAYLTGIARNLWLKHLQQQKRLPKKDATVLEQLPEEESQLHLQVLKERLFSDHLAKMGDNCRQILQWFFAKVSMKEVAQRLGSTESYIKKRKHICKERLIRNIEQDPNYRLYFCSL